MTNNKTISESHFNTTCDDKRFRRRSVPYINFMYDSWRVTCKGFIGKYI